MVLTGLEMMKERIKYEDALMQTIVFWASKEIQNSAIQSILIYQANAKLQLDKCF